jgi:hypothetical protein
MALNIEDPETERLAVEVAAPERFLAPVVVTSGAPGATSTDTLIDELAAEEEGLGEAAEPSATWNSLSAVDVKEAWLARQPE